MKKVPRSSYFLASTVFGGSLLGFAMGVALPFFLAPREYAHFSLNLALIQLIASVAFEWVRVSVLRHAGGEQEGSQRLRSNLKSLYTFMVLALLVVAAILGTLSIWLSTLLMPALICAVAAVQGAFDGRSAWARAKFDNVTLSIAALVRPTLSLVFVIGLAMATGSSTWAITGLLLSYPLSSLVFRDKIATLFNSLEVDRKASLSLLRFGVMAAFGTNIAMAVPALLRMIVVALFGLSGAGGVLFAFDIGQRIFSTIGMSLNLLHFQTLVRVIDTYPVKDAIQKARGAIAIEAMLFVGVVTMITVAAGPIGKIVAPPRYELDFVRHLPIFALLMAILCLRQYAVDALFIAFRKVTFIAVAPAITLALCGLAFFAALLRLIPREDIYILLVAASAVGFVIPFLFMGNFLRGGVPFGAFAASGVAAGCTILLTSGIGNANPIFALIMQSGAAFIVYCTILGGLALMQRLYRRSNGLSEAGLGRAEPPGQTVPSSLR